jgi:uncharacterized membrane protein
MVFFPWSNLLKKALSSLLVLIILLVVGSIVWLAVMPNKGDGFTEFYMLGIDGKAQAYPQSIALGDNASLILGIINRENKDTSYHILVKIDDVTITKINTGMVADGQKWEQQVYIMPVKTGANENVAFLLYKDENLESYQSLNLRVNVK